MSLTVSQLTITRPAIFLLCDVISCQWINWSASQTDVTHSSPPSSCKHEN